MRHLVFCAFALLVSSGCSRNSSAPVPGVDATPSASGSIVVRQGATRSMTVTFTPAGDQRIFDLAVTVGNLPPAWNAPDSFGCAVVDAGHPCVMTLAYSPASAGSGTLTLSYEYTFGRLRSPGTGSISLPYEATSNNNVGATLSPAGPAYARIGAGTRSVGVSFTTDDGLPATALALRTVSLPAGWSGTPSGFECATVSTGNGCTLALQYTPLAVDSGAFALEYDYRDNSGTPKSGSVNLVYAATSNNNVVGTAAPAGQINAVVGTGSQSVTVNFTTDDGNSASAFSISRDLGSLPAGWSTTASDLACATVSNGNGCQLTLQYAPLTVESGVLTLEYGYVDNSGASKSGSVDLPYASTSNNNVVSTAAPSGQINAVTGAGTQSVAVTFTTDDGNAASALAVTTDLSALPAGWSSTASAFACTTVSTGNGCQLPLSYSPSAVGSGNVILQFGYTDNSGSAKTGSITIPFASTADNNVAGTVTPSGQINAIAGAGGQTVTVVFATDDGNTASGFAVSTDLSSLAPGWSHSTGSFACAIVSGTSCELTLQFAPSAAASGTLTLGYGYTNNAGVAKTGTVAIDYVATAPVVRAYVAQLTSTLVACPLAFDGTLASCVATGGGHAAPTGIAFAGNYAYVSDYYDNRVWKCDVGAQGALSGCASTGDTFLYPMQLDVKDGWLYVANAINYGGISSCAIGVDGTLSGCTRTAGSGLIALEIHGDFLYTGNGNDLQVCSVALAGPPTGCSFTGSGFDGIWGVGLDAGYAYIGNYYGGYVTVCSRNSMDGSLSACSNYAVGGGPTDVTIRGSRAYVGGLYGDLNVCDIGAGNGLFNCASSTGGTSLSFVLQIAIR
jgi:hypothetical protein